MKTSLLTLSFCLAAGVAAVAAPAQDQTFQLFNKLRATASAAETHATDLEALTKTPSITWVSYARELDDLKADINVMGETLAAIENTRGNLTNAEREEIDQTAPLLRQMAADTSSAIRFINERTTDIWHPSYQKTLEDLGATSERLSKSLKTFVEITTLRDKEKHLEQDLGVAGF